MAVVNDHDNNMPNNDLSAMKCQIRKQMKTILDALNFSKGQRKDKDGIASHEVLAAHDVDSTNITYPANAQSP